MKKPNSWNLLNQLDRLPIKETEESRQLEDKITGMFLKLLLVCVILLLAVFVLKLLPQDYMLNLIAGCLAVVMGFRFFMEYYYGTVFTAYSQQMMGKDEKKIKRKKDQALFLTILCPALLCHIAFHSLLGTGTLVLLSWLILWYVIYTIAFHFYAESHPVSQLPQQETEEEETSEETGADEK